MTTLPTHPSGAPLLEDATPIARLPEYSQLLAEILHSIRAESAVAPVGVINQFAGSTPPPGWLLCHGQTVSRAEFPALFAVIGTTYGVGDGGTTFRLPDLRDRVPVGAGTRGLGATGGAETVALTVQEMPSHTHAQNAHTHGSAAHTHTINHAHAAATSGSAGAHTHTGLTVGGTTVGWASNQIDAAGTVATMRAGSQATVQPVNVNSAGAHTHTVNTPQHTGNSGSTTPGNVTATTAVNQSTGGGQAHENMPPFQTVNHIIRAL